MTSPNRTSSTYHLDGQPIENGKPAQFLASFLNRRTQLKRRLIAFGSETKCLMPSPSFHLKIVFCGQSENNRYLRLRTQMGPSAQSKPSASYSSLASLGISLSSRGSRRSIEPIGLSAFISVEEAPSAEDFYASRPQII